MLRVSAMSVLTAALIVPATVAQHVDVLVFDGGGQVAVGGFDVLEFSAIERRVFSARFDDFYAVNDPGWFSRPGDLPGSTDLMWDFLPMTVDSGEHAGHTSTLLYWNTETFESPEFSGSPNGHSLTLFGRDGASAKVGGTADRVPGHTIDRTAANGTIHQHLFFFLDDNGDGLNTTLPDPGIYLLAMQLRIDGLETSDPFFLVWATPDSSALTLLQPAMSWVESRVDTLVVDDVSPSPDINGDGSVDAADAGIMFASWGSVPPGDPITDLTGDGFVDAADAGIMFAEWTGDAGYPVPEPDTLAVAALVALLTRSRLLGKREVHHLSGPEHFNGNLVSRSSL